MANSENLFRFISLRPGKARKKRAVIEINVLPKDLNSTLRDAVIKIDNAGADIKKIEAQIQQFRVSKNYVANIEDLQLNWSPMLNWIDEHRNETFKAAGFEKLIEQRFGSKLSDLVKDKKYLADFVASYESMLSTMLLRGHSDVSQGEDYTVIVLKLLGTIWYVGKGELDVDNLNIGSYLGKSTLVFDFYTKVEQIQDLPDLKPTIPPSDDKDSVSAWIEQLESAKRDILHFSFDDRYRKLPTVKSTKSKNEIILERRVAELTKITSKDTEIYADNDSLVKSDLTGSFFLDTQVPLHKDTLAVLKVLRIEIGNLNPFVASSIIDSELLRIQLRIPADAPYNTIVALGGVYINKQQVLQARYKKKSPSKVRIKEFLSRCMYQVGLGDLLIVRQKLKAYELAEFAHVENALAREFKERTHKRIELTEEITTHTSELETERQRDLQSTERNEMQTEANKEVESKFNLEAGLQVSGSYGPVVSFSASLNTGFSTSVHESQSKSTLFSREVTEKSSEKVREKVTEEYRRKVLHKIVETNTHRIDNTAGAEHVRGVYRWLNKIYDAQIFNYGQRMMYEFVVPEPASFFIYATIQNPPNETEIIKPEPPKYNGNPLKPNHLSRSNYQNYVAQYQVTNVPEPPQEFVVKTFQVSQDGTDTATYHRSGTVEITRGYEAYAAVVNSDYHYKKKKNLAINLMLGRTNWDQTGFWGATYKNFNSLYVQEISYSLQVRNVGGFNLGVDILCRNTTQSFEKWQQAAYDMIMHSYQNLKAEYDGKMEQKELQQGVQILGRNPIENRRLEKEELKKLIIMIMLKNVYPDLRGYLGFNPYDASEPDEPILDLHSICPNGALIRFFENAFEWNNLTHVFYPYFWGEHAHWVDAIHFTDPDLDFAAFLKAGAARVQLPVRPGFEKAMAYYCQTGNIWNGGDVPVIGDDLYVPIVTEISENLGKLEDGVPYPEGSEPWEVTIPTSLVVLQDLDEIPNVQDMLTGNNVDFNNEQ